MIIKGNKVNPCVRCGASKNLAAHLSRTDTNEAVKVKEMKGFISTDLEGALWEINATAQATQAEKAAYHAKFAPAHGERFTDEQILNSADKLEKELGFEGLPRAIIEHEKKGEQHFHVVWSRIDLERGVAIDTPNNYEKHEKISYELEKEYGLQQVKGALYGREVGNPRVERAPKDWEYQQAERLQLKNPREVKAEIEGIYNSAENGHQLRAELEKAGYVLAVGDKNGALLAVFQGENGAGHKSILRCVEDKKAAFDAKTADLDRSNLPNLEQAQEFAPLLKEVVAERLQIEKTQAAESASVKDIEKAAREVFDHQKKLNPDLAFIIEARDQAAHVPQLVEMLQAGGYAVLAVNDNDLKTIEKQRATGHFIPELFKGDLAAMNDKGHIFRVTEDGRGKNAPWVAAYGANNLNDKQQAAAEKSYNKWIEGKEEQKAESGKPYKPFTFREYVQFVQDKYRDKHSTLDFAAFDKTGLNSITEEQQQRRQNYLDQMKPATLSKTAQTFRAIIKEAGEKDLSAAMAEKGFFVAVDKGGFVAVNKWGSVLKIGEVNTGLIAEKIEQRFEPARLVSVIEAAGKARDFTNTEKLQRREDWQKQRDERSEEAAKINAPTLGEQIKHGHKEALRNLQNIKRSIENPMAAMGEGLRVIGAGGKILGGVLKVAEDFIKMFDPPKYSPHTAQEIFKSEAAEREDLEYTRAEKRSAAALDRMSEDMKKGRNLQQTDLQTLSRDRLEEIRSKGDDALRLMIEGRERQRELEREREKGRRLER